MPIVNVHQAKTHLSKLLERAARGERIIIARAGKPVAVLGPLAPASRMREAGLLQGRVRIAKDFDAPLPKDVLEDFYEGAIQPD